MSASLLGWLTSSIPDANAEFAYSTATPRNRGLGPGAPFPLFLFNGFLYQGGVAISAIQRWLTFRNLTCSDGTGILLAALKSMASTADQQELSIVVSSGSPSPNLDVSAYDGVTISGWKFFEIVLNGNAVAPTVSGIVPGVKVVLWFVQAGGGGFTWVYPTQFKGGGTPSTSPGGRNLQKFIGTPDGNLRAVGPMST